MLKTLTSPQLPENSRLQAQETLSMQRKVQGPQEDNTCNLQFTKVEQWSIGQSSGSRFEPQRAISKIGHNLVTPVANIA